MYVVVNFLSQVIFVFLLFWGMVMYANEVETSRDKREIKNKLQPDFCTDLLIDKMAKSVIQ